ncbi:hypothetical protein SAMN02745947_02726 [Rhodococcus rhodochrous J3]|uniref:Uncharacterized protein n=2 Tax=Rhodococcus rhodochrous TaxID=1829 RepID=A0AA46WY18_RHORH|nr:MULTISPECIES: hypothetical protein [Rhodococcus]AYA25295.1 hypothetical protein C6369_012960 [Rhodococcus rhodochrous]MBF4478521.1 hypothetical protein [Rhodococcus rhodochrous]MCB8913049.1 hypothetical protein [Rhodococcus rhodochrous]MDC3725504.1 hypothetical protein [Rhodococcus sp. Rp3]MDJ0398798.1 hypothetical protein [Rhodococcus rhodochrous]
MTTGSLLDRYEEYRTRRFLKNEEITGGWMPNWRTRRRRRILAVAVVALIALMFAVAIASYFTMAAAIVWLPAALIFLPAWTCLQIVSGRQSDAPRHALDEREIAERNSARSIGLSVAQALLLIPIFTLLFGASIDSLDHQALAYSMGGLALASILFSGCLPAVLLAWTRPDDDPEDLL